jgi:VWFA-related protein
MKPAFAGLATIALCFAAVVGGGQLDAQQAGEISPPPGGVKIQVNVNSVLVPVVVRDAQGRAVGDLRKEDFEVFDKDKPRVISGFTVQTRAAAPENSRNAGIVNPAPGGGIASAPQDSGEMPGRLVVFLFDDLHMSAADLAGIKSSAKNMLQGALTGSDRAAVISIFGREDSGVTNDRAQLGAAIAKIQLRGPYRRTGRQCPDVDYYHADRIENRQDTEALETAVLDALSCAHLEPNMRTEAEAMARQAARESLAQGERDVRVTLTFLRELTRRLGTVPGERTIILISPGFFTGTHEGMTLQSQVVDAAARANVTISTLDPRGLYTTALQAGEEADGPARTIRLKADAHVQSAGVIEDVMAELADGTGGTFFHNSNDFDGGLRRLAAAPEYVYLLEFSIEGVKPDGAYHRLKVKVDQSDLKLQARRGYFAPKTEKNK